MIKSLTTLFLALIFCLKMPKDSSVKHYVKKERLQKKAKKGTKIFLKRKKTKNENMVANDIKIFLNMKKKAGWV